MLSSHKITLDIGALDSETLSHDQDFGSGLPENGDPLPGSRRRREICRISASLFEQTEFTLMTERTVVLTEVSQNVLPREQKRSKAVGSSGPACLPSVRRMDNRRSQSDSTRLD